jgi:hypothetical protein
MRIARAGQITTVSIMVAIKEAQLGLDSFKTKPSPLALIPCQDDRYRTSPREEFPTVSTLPERDLIRGTCVQRALPT